MLNFNRLNSLSLSRLKSYSSQFIGLCLVLLLGSCVPANQAQNQLEYLKKETGLREIPSPDGQGTYLGKTHHGYEVLFTTQMGNVWGRWAARVGLGELLAFVSDGAYRTPVAGSQLDRLLSRVIGQPLTIIVIVKHKKPSASRLDIITPFSTVPSEDPLPKARHIGLNTGSIYSRNLEFVDRIASDKDLMGAISDLWSPYIRVDERAVTYIYAGPETDLSSMIRQHGSYPDYINSVMYIAASIADKI